MFYTGKTWETFIIFYWSNLKVIASSWRFQISVKCDLCLQVMYYLLEEQILASASWV